MVLIWSFFYSWPITAILKMINILQFDIPFKLRSFLVIIEFIGIYCWGWCQWAPIAIVLAPIIVSQVLILGLGFLYFKQKHPWSRILKAELERANKSDNLSQDQDSSTLPLFKPSDSQSLQDIPKDDAHANVRRHSRASIWFNTWSWCPKKWFYVIMHVSYICDCVPSSC